MIKPDIKESKDEIIIKNEIDKITNEKIK